MSFSASAGSSSRLMWLPVTRLAQELMAGCDTLYSEDMQDGQVFEGRLTVINPFSRL
jgi:predicted nucleic acid-binding protein